MANSQLEQTTSLVDAVVAAVLAAWPEVEERITVLEQRREENRRPYAHVDLDVLFQPQTIKTIAQVHAFRVSYVADIPEGVRLLTTKLAKSNALIALFMANQNFISEAYLPEITAVQLTEDDPVQGQYVVSVTFTVTIDQDTI